jgi:hypothetical protein
MIYNAVPFSTRGGLNGIDLTITPQGLRGWAAEEPCRIPPAVWGFHPIASYVAVSVFCVFGSFNLVSSGLFYLVASGPRMR